MKNQQQIYQKISAILYDICDISADSLSLDSNLQRDLSLDSAQLLGLAAEIENHWELYLEEAPDNPPTTVRELVHLVELRLREKQTEVENG